ncbi:hypothetical protein LDJ69_24230, partial [Escherichia coli]|uniref:hypothetical protein n=1 Tax=Escherichia coli TaxID=562 RepID=UPI001CDA261D
TVCVVGKMRDLILQLSKSSIYSTKPGDGANSRCIAHYVLPKQSLQQAVTVISAVCTHPGS